MTNMAPILEHVEETGETYGDILVIITEYVPPILEHVKSSGAQ